MFVTAATVRWGRRTIFAASLAVFAIAVGPSTPRPGRRTPCELAVAAPADEGARAACEHSASAAGADRELALLGHLALVRGEMDTAEGIAHRLALGARAADGHALLCEVLSRTERGQLGYDHGRQAHDAHQRQGDDQRVMRDALCMSQAAWQSGNLDAALESAEETVRLATRLGARTIEVRAQIATADALRRIGAQTEARNALERAVARSTTSCDLAWSHLKAGMLHAEAEEPALARLDLDHAAHANQSCEDAQVAQSLALNQAALLLRDDPDLATHILDQHAAMYGDDMVEVLLLRGLIAGNRGDGARAARLLDEAAGREPPDADWPWEIERARAELAASLGTPDGAREAETRYRSSMAMVAALRGTAPTHSAFLLASHRAPFDGLIVLLARQGRWRDALAVVLELDAGDMLQAAVPGARGRLQAAGTHPSVDAVIEAWRERDVVIVLAPTSRLIGKGLDPVVRLHMVGGEVSGEFVASANAARDDAAALFEAPDDVAAARRLGDLVLPDDGRADPLRVLLVGRLGRVPLAALRDGSGSLVIEHRPLERVLSLRPQPPIDPATERAVIIADPIRDLPSARLEGKQVAERVGPDALLAGPDGVPAIRARLEDARHATLLHIAAHVTVRGRWRALQLADHAVTPADIVALGLAPHLAVLASCGSGAAHDEEGWGSIAAAMLSSGTAAVVATDRSVGDAAATQVVTSFYAQPDWSSDPSRALARVQAALAHRGVPAAEWAPFTVFRGGPVAP